VQNRGEVAREQRKPVLLVDVDGVISLWGFASDTRPPGAFASVDGIPHFLSQRAAEHLLALSDAYELVWCTGWEEKANEVLPHALGLGPLPYLSFDHTPPGTTTPGHWKLAAIDAYVDGRPAAWVDDALNDACRTWAAERTAPTLLVETDPAEGLVAAHTRELREWAENL
jgi:HAD domain in Swiss Army Knife RNA repair proteins